MTQQENRLVSRRLSRLVVLGACLILVAWAAVSIGLRQLGAQAPGDGKSQPTLAPVGPKAPARNANPLTPARDTIWSPGPGAGEQPQPGGASNYPMFNAAGPTPTLMPPSRFDRPAPAQTPLRPIADRAFGYLPTEGLLPGVVHSPSNGSLVDLVGLANSQVEALKEQGIARFQHERLEQLYKAAAVSNEELEIARIKLAAAERRLALLKGIAERAQKAAQMEADILRSRIKAWESSGAASPVQIQDVKIQLAQAEARLETLKEILSTTTLAPGKGERMTAETKSGDTGATTEKGGPQDALRQFLEAVRSGDGHKAEAMFTQAARQRITEMKLNVTPPRNEAATFSLGEMKLIDQDNAEVKAQWTSVDKDGRKTSDEMTWRLHKVPEGWRIKGSTASVIPGQPPVVLDFEDLQESLDRVNKAVHEKGP